MATGGALSPAAQLAASLPKLSVGCHVVLVDGAPVLTQSRVPSLAPANQGAEFIPTLGSFIKQVATGRLAPAELEAEATAQFQKLQAMGVNLTHFDSHKHTHLFPAVLRPTMRAARACGIRALRNPFVPPHGLAFEDLRRRPHLWKRYLQTRALRRFLPAFRDLVAEFGMTTTDGCIGVIETGFLDADLFAAVIRALATELPEGTWELVCHPGYKDAELAGVRTRLRASREEERNVLTSSEARTLLDKHGIELISFRDLSGTA